MIETQSLYLNLHLNCRGNKFNEIKHKLVKKCSRQCKYLTKVRWQKLHSTLILSYFWASLIRPLLFKCLLLVVVTASLIDGAQTPVVCPTPYLGEPSLPGSLHVFKVVTIQSLWVRWIKYACVSNFFLD